MKYTCLRHWTGIDNIAATLSRNHLLGSGLSLSCLLKYVSQHIYNDN